MIFQAVEILLGKRPEPFSTARAGEDFASSNARVAEASEIASGA
jgi:hypothetical protein